MSARLLAQLGPCRLSHLTRYDGVTRNGEQIHATVDHGHAARVIAARAERNRLEDLMDGVARVLLTGRTKTWA